MMYDRVLMPTETMVIIGMREDHPMTGAVTPIMDLRPGQRLRLSMSATTSCRDRETGFSTTVFTATANWCCYHGVTPTLFLMTMINSLLWQTRELMP